MFLRERWEVRVPSEQILERVGLGSRAKANRWLKVDVERLKELQPEVVLRAWVRLCSNGLEAGIDAQLELELRAGSAQEASD